MSLVSKPYTFTVGATIVASEHNSNFDTIYNDYNGNIANANISGSAAISYSKLSLTGGIVNADISGSAAITDNKLAQITTASKVAGDALTSLANIPSGAGIIPRANMPSGTIIQVKNFDYTAFASGTGVIPWDNTIPQFFEGFKFMDNATITPTASTNYIKVLVNASLSHSVANGQLAATLFLGSGTGALRTAGADNNTDTVKTVPIEHYLVAGTTTALTFKVRAGADTAGTTGFNGISSGAKYGSTTSSSITLIEVAG